MKRRLFGLALVGGRSIRMGRDKALISYNGTETQLERSTALLKAVCQDVFVSQRKDQAYEIQNFANVIYDSVNEVKGPLCGILSAMYNHPGANWLVIACDLPNLDDKVLRNLVREFESESPQLIAYKSSYNGLPEPLCAIYPAGSARELLTHSRELNSYCPRKILIAMDARLVEQDNPTSLNNVNTTSEYNDSIKSS
ncbi:MAG: molybdenum cofactor guanylyltransferase [Puniceicoccaceae bacterium]|nr:molybdenum cofactor guanylyltransferase [Puniceicoccaceae bacterium]RCL35387.1 MAG: molybdenum cofactor guanylyltransferase [Puniceicoccaceae bacterium]|tara:strand:- start:9510 stop:10100 length:591 start_codon:yes stop_codon:yes gene_type:complete